MANKSRILVFICLIILSGCYDPVDYQELEINNDDTTIRVLNENYVIDSIAWDDGSKDVFLVNLIDKSKGLSKISVEGSLIKYDEHINIINHNQCDTIYGGVVFIRKKEFKERITDSVARQLKYYQEIQKFLVNYNPCKDGKVKIKALRRYK